MNEDELKLLESRLASMQPTAPSSFTAHRVGESIARAESRAVWASRLLKIAAVILLALVLTMVLVPVVLRTQRVAWQPPAADVASPTLASYQRAADASDQQLDALLGKQSAQVLPAPARRISSDAI